MHNVDLKQGDCLELMKDIKDQSLDMILCDLPYGTTACKWDIVIPFAKLWEQYKRIIKPNGCIALFGSEPFSSHLRLSNLKWFKYDWVWNKNQATNHLNAKNQPMRKTELISVFYKKQSLYNPQLTKKDPKNIRPPTIKREQTAVYGKMTAESKRGIPIDASYPNEILKFKKDNYKSNCLHPTQKPVALLEYLIKTYTQEGEIILDNTMGSGSTGVAAVNLNRNFIGMEKEKEYFKIARKRIYKIWEGWY